MILWCAPLLGLLYRLVDVGWSPEWSCCAYAVSIETGDTEALKVRLSELQSAKKTGDERSDIEGKNL